MSGVRPRLSTEGPATYPVSALIKGGQVVAGHTDGKARPATAGDRKVLGVAEIDAAPARNRVSTNQDGFEQIDLAPLPEHVVCGFNRYPVKYAANADFGVALKAAANGEVTPWVSGTDAADLIIGYCDEPTGVVVASKAVGLAYISR